MKGYGVFLLVVIAVLLAIPPLFVSRDQPPSASPTVTAPKETTDRFTVLHADQSTVSEIDAYDLTLYSVIGSVSADVSAEVIKAQTIACYSLFCCQKAERDADAAADILSTALPFPESYTEAYWRQQWGEAFEQTMTVYRTAVDEVFGQQLLYEGKPIMALSHTMNAGKTESAAVVLGEALPYLVSVASPADALDERQLTTVTFSTEQAIPVLSSLCGKTEIGDAQSWFTALQKSDAGTVTSVTVAGVPLDGAAVQAAFALPSAAFEVCVQEGQVIFTVSGNGHFVGMSLCGAQGMAQNEHSYREILAHYYPKTNLSA